MSGATQLQPQRPAHSSRWLPASHPSNKSAPIKIGRLLLRFGLHELRRRLSGGWRNRRLRCRRSRRYSAHPPVRSTISSHASPCLLRLTLRWALPCRAQSSGLRRRLSGGRRNRRLRCRRSRRYSAHPPVRSTISSHASPCLLRLTLRWRCPAERSKAAPPICGRKRGGRISAPWRADY